MLAFFARSRLICWVTRGPDLPPGCPHPYAVATASTTPCHKRSWAPGKNLSVSAHPSSSHCLCHGRRGYHVSCGRVVRMGREVSVQGAAESIALFETICVATNAVSCVYIAMLMCLTMRTLVHHAHFIPRLIVQTDEPAVCLSAADLAACLTVRL